MSAGPVKIIEWTPEIAVHVPEIDREHRGMFDLLNRLHQAMLAGKGKNILKPLLGEVTQYTLVHFAHEEELMAAVSYPGLREQVEQHQALRRRTRVFAERYQRGEVTMTIELTLFLAEWLKDHIMTVDRRLGEFINANGSAPAPPVSAKKRHPHRPR
jgi:hemerythrin-like metal-binding protein